MVGLGERGGRLCLAQPRGGGIACGLERSRIDVEERFALLHHAALRDTDLLDVTGDARAQLHLFDRGQRAGELGEGRDRADDDLGHGHTGRRGGATARRGLLAASEGECGADRQGHQGGARDCHRCTFRDCSWMSGVLNRSGSGDRCPACHAWKVKRFLLGGPWRGRTGQSAGTATPPDARSGGTPGAGPSSRSVRWVGTATHHGQAHSVKCRRGG